MYSSKFVFLVLANKQQLKERADGIVAIPWGTEYSLKFRNKNSRTAVVTFTIDGENASENGYVIAANDSVEIKRYAHKDVRFKFVSLESDEAADFGKSDNAGGEKGVIEARFRLEKVVPVPPAVEHHYVYPQPYYPRPSYYPRPPSAPWFSEAPWSPLRDGGQTFDARCGHSTSQNSSHEGQAAPESRMLRTMGFPTQQNTTPSGEGCTVEGASSGQTFRPVHMDFETDFVSLKVVLRGVAEMASVAAPMTANSHCTQCGSKFSRTTDKFCGACGNQI